MMSKSYLKGMNQQMKNKARKKLRPYLNIFFKLGEKKSN